MGGILFLSTFVTSGSLKLTAALDSSDEELQSYHHHGVIMCVVEVVNDELKLPSLDVALHISQHHTPVTRSSM